MLKKIVFIIILPIILATTYIITADSNELPHIQSQIKSVLRSWQRAEMTVQQAKDIAPKLYDDMQTVAINILAQEDIAAKITKAADEQYNAIVNNNMSYKSIDFLGTYFPNKKKILKPYLYTLCQTMSNLQYRLLLWRKLVKKEKELAAEVESKKSIDVLLDDLAKQ